MIIWVRDNDVCLYFFKLNELKVYVKLIKVRKDGGMKVSIRNG